ncbi:hypothetical protein SELMODRAFT_429174 [Selaginella moellendorffii]|uniref:Pentacotripeptide-repeat region of PRORP domain-containing protein n=1 Tax=Selaginella moellendorffii TaxID=88036 RepID=D8T5A2_SELML|nr:hypothetical protein SELMODRAFT_429174 [Selaginella moellendorffii]
MESVCVEASFLTYGAIIDGCTQTGELAIAFGIYRIMLSKLRSGAVKRALEVFTELKSESPIDPNHAIMCFLMDACSKAGDPNFSGKLRSLHHDAQVWNPRIPGALYSSCSCMQQSFSIYNDMKEEHVKPDEIFFSVLIDVAGHGGKFDCTFVLQEVEMYSLILGDVIFSSLTGVSSTLLQLTRAKRSSRILSNEQENLCVW